MNQWVRPPLGASEDRSVRQPRLRRQDDRMNSRVHPKYQTKYRVSNWPEYGRSLVRRGDVTLWLSPEAIAAWRPARAGRRGGQLKYSDLAIETALTLRLVFGLPLRKTEAFLASVLRMMGVKLEVTDHTTMSHRSQHLGAQLHRSPTGNPILLVIDSTGLSIVGEEGSGRPLNMAGRAGGAGRSCTLGWMAPMSLWPRY